MVTIESLRQLQTEEGSHLLTELAELKVFPATTVATATRLRKRYPAELVTAAMAMAELRGRARSKFGAADCLWFTREGLEQATSEVIGLYRASRFAGQGAVMDLCCGIGGDLMALAQALPDTPIVAVDRDPLHLEMARLNTEALGVDGTLRFVEADVRTVALPDIGAVFIDPARRSGGRRMALGESEPPLEWSVGLATSSRAVAIKAAPGLDHARVPDGWEFEAIALGSDLKEATLWSPGLARAVRTATVLADGASHHLEHGPGEPVPVREPQPGDWLIDPSPAVTRAGLVQDLARMLGHSTAMIDPRIAFLVTSGPSQTPFGRSLRIVDSLPWHERNVKARLKELGAGPVDVRRRGLAGDVDAIAKRIRGKGERPFTVAMTRTMDAPWAIVCEPEA